MRIINIDATKNSTGYTSVFGGYVGEHNNTEIQIKLPDNLKDNTYTYQWHFGTSYGEEYRYFGSTLDGDTICCPLYKSVTKKGRLEVQVEVYKVELVDGKEEKTFIGKTGIIPLLIKDSVEGTLQNGDIDLGLDEMEYIYSLINNKADKKAALQRQIVSKLPTENIKENTIYLVPKENATDNDNYDEYIFIPNESNNGNNSGSSGGGTSGGTSGSGSESGGSSDNGNSGSSSGGVSSYYTYIVIDGNAIIKSVDTSISGDITIPSELDGYTVTKITNDGFQNCTKLTSVIIPSSVTFVTAQAFSGCTSLISVTFPDSVTSISGNIFAGCTSLTSVTILNSTASINSVAFYGCNSEVEIHGYSGSTAETFANENNITFVALD